jgi:hypothetical protein
MNPVNCKPLLLLLSLLLSLSTIFGQQAKDTIYFDEDFFVCERPVAEYYSACNLNKVDNIFYKGKVEDYFIDGNLKVIGNYTESGSKEGEFIFMIKEVI